MGLLSWLRGKNQDKNLREVPRETNPATGLEMDGYLDTAGNPWGLDFHASNQNEHFEDC